MTEQTQRAKELYIQFLGHFLNMHKAGVLKEYKSFEIPREVELEWLQEWAHGARQAVVDTGLGCDYDTGIHFAELSG